MSIALQGFKVVTEFVFNADNAIMGVDALNKKVDSLTKSAEDAVSVVAKMGLSYAMSFSGATGGILGVLGNAIKASDKFKATQIELANFMVSNKASFMGGAIGFQDALEQSGFIMDGIIKKARGLGISPDQFVSQVKSTEAFLRPKGLSGDNLEKSIELARVSMKSAPALGVSQFQAQSGVQSGISGQLSKNTQFGRRLFLEAGDAIKEATGGVVKDLKSFNKASGKVRVEALIAGLDKLAGPMDVVNARADTLTSRMFQIMSLFSGVGSILKPLGDVILPVIKDTLDLVIKYLKTDGVKIVREMAKFIKGFLSGPKEMMIQFGQLKELSKDIGTATAIASIGMLIANITHLTKFLGGFKLTRGIANFAEGIGSLVTRIPIVGKMIGSMANSFHKMFSLNLGGGFMKTIMSVGGVMARMAGFIGVLLIPLQGLSQAIERIKIESAVNAVSIIPKVMEHINSMVTSIKRFISPITDLIDGWSELFYLLIGGAKSFKWITDITYNLSVSMEVLSTTFLVFWGTIKGIVAGMVAVVASISTGNFSNLGEMFKDASFDEFSKTMNSQRAPTLGPEGEQGVVGGTVINQKITMNNSFKEVMQPDRIAFTIASQLKKKAENRTSSAPTNSTAKAQMSI